MSHLRLHAPTRLRAIAKAAALAWSAAAFAAACAADPDAASSAAGGDPAPAPAAPAPIEAPAGEPPAAEPPAAPLQQHPDDADDPSCPAGMALVAGNYCLTAEQRCVAWQEIPGAPKSRDQCTRFAEPVTCFEDRRRPMRFCMDRYEWPNRRGEKPRTLTSWQDARALCASAGKRLCTEEEFNFACEGESMRPYVYGHVRDDTRCWFDRPYRARTFDFTAWDTCHADPACRAAFEAIDQRRPAGSMPGCRSEHGVYDLNGNANEWVFLPHGRTPRRSGIKGGWWGPVRARCRPTVTFHDEGDFGYEVGFRCCGESQVPEERR